MPNSYFTIFQFTWKRKQVFVFFTEMEEEVGVFFAFDFEREASFSRFGIFQRDVGAVFVPSTKMSYPSRTKGGIYISNWHEMSFISSNFYVYILYQ